MLGENFARKIILDNPEAKITKGIVKSSNSKVFRTKLFSEPKLEEMIEKLYLWDYVILLSTNLRWREYDVTEAKL